MAFTDPTWIKAQPHASAEKQIGDSDPLARTDVVNRPAKGLWANFQRLANALFVSPTFDGTDVATTTAHALGLTILKGLNEFRLTVSGANLTLERACGHLVNIAGTLRAASSLPTLAPPDTKTQIEGMTRAAACAVTWTGHGLYSGDSVSFADITQAGWTALNGNSYVVTVTGADTFTIPVNTSGYAADYVPATDDGTYRKPTLEYIYALFGADITLEASTTAYTLDTATGRPEKTGDTSRLLLGMAMVDHLGAWPASADSLLLRNWANEKPKAASLALSSTTTITANAWTEVSSTIRVPFLAWGDEYISGSLSGRMTCSTSNLYVALGYDGIVPEAPGGAFAQAGGAGYPPIGLTAPKKPALGRHYLTALAKSNGSATLGLYGSANAGEQSVVSVWIGGR